MPVWGVEYSLVNGSVSQFAQTSSNGSVAGIVSSVATEFITDFNVALEKVYKTIGDNVPSLTTEQFTKRYEIEMSKAMLIALAANTIPVPVQEVQLRRSAVVTRLPALAL